MDISSSDWNEFISTFENSLKTVNDLYWNISFQKKDDKWWLWGGDALIGTFETKTEMEVFISGMALALGVLP